MGSRLLQQAVIRQTHKAVLCDILIELGSPFSQWALGKHADTIYPKFCPTCNTQDFFFLHSVFCISVTWGFHSVKSVLGAEFAFRCFNVVFAVLLCDISLKTCLETTWQWLLWFLICRGGTSPLTKTHDSWDETALLFTTKDRQENVGSLWWMNDGMKWTKWTFLCPTGTDFFSCGNKQILQTLELNPLVSILFLPFTHTERLLAPLLHLCCLKYLYLFFVL